MFGTISPIRTNRKYFFLLCFILIELVVLIDYFKIKTIQLPFTSFDFISFFNNPYILFSSVGLSDFFGLIIILGLILILIYLSYYFYFRSGIKLINVFIYVLLFCFSFYGSNWLYSNFTRNTYKNWKKSWYTSSILEIDRRLGSIGFLYFSSIDSIKNDNFINNNNLKQIHNYPLKTLSLNPGNTNLDSLNKLPNIVYFLAESTFNPNNVFKTKYFLKDNYLFVEKNKLEKNQRLFVNVVGGGTNMSEFEALTGLDSRLFGVYGQYTHAFLSSKIKQSFLFYLKKLGYNSTAFYPVLGNFYGAKFGYTNYGIDRFIESSQLNIDHEYWNLLTDSKFVEKTFKFWNNKQPFVYCYTSLYNHSPHDNCSSFNRKFNLLDTNDESLNCKIDVFLNRATDTEKAVYAVQKKLDHIYRTTGRPYIIVIYGDHQPYAFSYDERFDKFRIDPTVKTETFVKYIASNSYLLPRINEGYSLTLLPSIISSCLFRDFRKWYFPEQVEFYLNNGRAKNYDDYLKSREFISQYNNYINLD